MNEGVKSSAGTPERYDTAKAERIETAVPVRNGTAKAERIETVREIGRGGSSVVYLVKDTQDGRLYAMKLVNEKMMSSEAVMLSEAEILQKLGTEGSGIPAFYGALPGDGPGSSASSGDGLDDPDSLDGSDSPATGFLMEYIEGDSLQKLLDGGRTFTVRETAEAGLSFCAILGKLHGSDPPLIYRDFKPANILIRRDGSYVLIDYGACRIFKTEASRDTKMLGTEGYAAPEQYGGWEQSDVRTDIYGIGAVLHHMLTGRHPLETGLGSVAELMQSPYKPQECGANWMKDNPQEHGLYRQMNNPQEHGLYRQMNDPQAYGLYREMDKVLRRCCSVSPDMRFSSCSGLEKALRRVLEACKKAEKAAERTREKPDVLREQMWKRFLVLAACAVTFLFGSGMFSVSAAGAGMARYHMFIREGEAVQETDAKKERYLQAIRLRPSDAEAYIAFLADLASDGVISQGEREAFEDLLYTDDYLEDMRASAPGQYASLELEIGKLYWGFYDGGTEPAGQAIENAMSTGVPLGKRKMAQAMHEILAVTPSDYAETSAEKRYSAWHSLQILVREEAEKTGEWNFALAVSRMALGEIALRADSYTEDYTEDMGEPEMQTVGAGGKEMYKANGEENEMAAKVFEEADKLYEPFRDGRLEAPDGLTEALREAVQTAKQDQWDRTEYE